MIEFAYSNVGYHAAKLHFDGCPEHTRVNLNQRHNSIDKVVRDGKTGKFTRACKANYLHFFENGNWYSHKL